MKNFRKGINMGKNIVFDLLVIVGGLALIILIGKAIFKNAETDTKIVAKAAEMTSDEGRYSAKKDEFIEELNTAFKEEVLDKNPGLEKNLKYEVTDTYLGGGVYKIEMLITMYDYDNIVGTAYYDVVEEDGFGIYQLNGSRIDGSILNDLYPELDIYW